MENKQPKTFEDFKQAGMNDENAQIYADLAQKGLVTEAKYSRAGARFLIRRANGGIVGIYTTDKDGKFIAKNLPAGTYTIKQIAAADGFTIDEKPKVVTVTAGGYTEITYTGHQREHTFLRQVSSGTTRQK